jgi:long-chain acyl-CoA synthetase
MLAVGPHVHCTHLAPTSTNLADLFLRRVRHSATANAFFTKRDGQWVGTTWGAWHTSAHGIAEGIAALGVETGDRVAILGPTTAPWAEYEMGAQLAGCVSLGIYPKQSADQVRYLLSHSEAKVVFVADAVELATVIEAADETCAVIAIVPWDPELIDGVSDARVRILPSPGDGGGDGVVEARHRSRGPEDTAIFVYTSGTTGPPKCAMISHGNILAVLGVQDALLDFYEDDISLSFLPMAHVAERVLAFYGRMSAGIATAYASSIAAVLDELQEVRPTVFGSVPRIFEKAYGKVQSELAKKSPRIQKIFAWATQIGVRRVHLILEGQRVPIGLRIRHHIADRLVFSKVRAAFGGRVRQFITGAAPIPLEILEFFWAAGLPIFEVYGMTEATVLTHGNRPGATRLGTVGRIADPLEHRLADDGEILIRGPFIFQGYFKDPAATDAAIIDGWLHTGDIGTIDADGYLKITDRKKHIIITAGGKNLAPANIENAAKASDPLINQVHAHADKRPYVSALVAPSPIETLEFGVGLGIVSREDVQRFSDELMTNPTSRSDALAKAMEPVTQHPHFRARIKTAIQLGNESLARVEKIKRFVILPRDFSQEAGELTPTMKVKRKAIEIAYLEHFDQIYSDEDYAISVN